MQKDDKPRNERRTYAKPKVTRRRRLTETTEGVNILVTGKVVD